MQATGNRLIRILCVICFTIFQLRSFGQLDQSNLIKDTSRNEEKEVLTYPNTIAGEFTPGKGFDLVKTKAGSLNVSLFAIARYLNQLPGNQTWYDHLGRPQEFTGRNDIYWHRTMIWFSGFL